MFRFRISCASAYGGVCLYKYNSRFIAREIVSIVFTYDTFRFFHQVSYQVYLCTEVLDILLVKETFQSLSNYYS